MAAVTTFFEHNGAATGTPPRGTTQTQVSLIEYKNIDDATTPRGSSPIVAGQNSFGKYNFLAFTGTFNQISSVLFAHTSGVLGTGLSLVGRISSTYATPSTTGLSGATDISAVTPIASGMPVNLSPTGPFNDADMSSSLTTAGFSQYFITQLQSTAAAAAGDTTQMTLTIQYNEN